MAFDDWGPVRKPRPPKPVTDETVVADVEQRQRRDDRSLVIGAKIGLGRIGGAAEDDVPAADWDTLYPVTFRPLGSADLFQSTVRVRTTASYAGLRVFVSLYGLGTGGPNRGVIYGDHGAALDVGITSPGVEATAYVGWLSDDPGDGPAQLDIEIMTVPLR